MTNFIFLHLAEYILLWSNGYGGYMHQCWKFEFLFTQSQILQNVIS